MTDILGTVMAMDREPIWVIIDDYRDFTEAELDYLKDMAASAAYQRLIVAQARSDLATHWLYGPHD